MPRVIDSFRKTADTFSLLADPTRLSILRVLLENKEYCVGDIAGKVGVSLSAVSHQLSRLEARGVVYCYRNGQKFCYKLATNPLTKKLKMILQLVKNN